MKRLLAFSAALCLLTGVSLAQPGQMPQLENVILMQRASFTIQYGGPTRVQGRSYNFTPVFFIYPDGKLDKEGAEKLLADMDIQPLLDANYGMAVVVNPTGEKYDANADYEVFGQLFNMFRGPGNLKVVGLGAGAGLQLPV